MAPFKVTAESLGHQAIGAFRNIADARQCDGSTVYAYRRELPLSFRVERWIKDRVTMTPSKKELEKEATK